MTRERIRSTCILNHTHYHQVIFIGSECEEKKLFSKRKINTEMYKGPIYVLLDPLFPL